MSRAVFLAAPDRGHAAEALVEALLRELQVTTGGALRGSDVFVPAMQVGDVGIDATAEAYFSRSLEALQQARVVIAVLDGPQVDESVAFWLGYAFAASKPIVGYRTDRRDSGPMVGGAVADVAHDGKSLAAALARWLL